ncbi:hypothetical protein HBN50_05165 [Halobacteriovorax sp. GB3]|uniref:hypothetical protein n=1 Tax=Halobacteriovorax sp. GB3 TaxID=2719615 RepID=UPI0023600EB8|nr:hypothetical protein [Halobacteriovorax sp. GB3]MDD0852475.1 hypothetical protein [Halobacteriovorax sp. GB3]
MNIEDVLKSKEEKEKWVNLYEKARETLPLRDVKDEELLNLLKESQTLEQFSTLFLYIFRYGKSNPNGRNAIITFFEYVDKSSYSLSEWIKTIQIFDTWIKEQERSTDFLKMIGYLQCADQSPDNIKLTHDFDYLVSEMLERYGYDG